MVSIPTSSTTPSPDELYPQGQYNNPYSPGSSSQGPAGYGLVGDARDVTERCQPAWCGSRPVLLSTNQMGCTGRVYTSFVSAPYPTGT